MSEVLPISKVKSLHFHCIETENTADEQIANHRRSMLHFQKDKGWAEGRDLWYYGFGKIQNKHDKVAQMRSEKAHQARNFYTP